MSDDLHSATVRRYGKCSISLPDGRAVFGHKPGFAGRSLLEHVLRDLLAIRLGGLTEVVLPYGRADIGTATQIIEVEPLGSYRHGIRQVLAYAAQCGLDPQLALFGKASPQLVLEIYLRLRDGRPPIGLWWFDGMTWQQISRSRCRRMYNPAPGVGLR